jgi:hypothetical protein
MSSILTEKKIGGRGRERERKIEKEKKYRTNGK